MWITRHCCKKLECLTKHFQWYMKKLKKTKQSLCLKRIEFHTPNTHIQSDAFTQHAVRCIFPALGSVEHVDNLNRWPWCRHHHLTVIIAEPSCNICASHQRLIPHLLCIMQTIAYSIKTCPPSTHIVWRAPQCNSVIKNECRVRVSSLAD